MDGRMIQLRMITSLYLAYFSNDSFRYAQLAYAYTKVVANGRWRLCASDCDFPIIYKILSL